MIRNPASKPCSSSIDLKNPIRRIVKGQAAAVAAKAIGQHNIRPSLNKASMHGHHPLGMIDIPKLARRTIRQAKFEQTRPHRPIRKEIRTLR